MSSSWSVAGLLGILLMSAAPTSLVHVVRLLWPSSALCSLLALPVFSFASYPHFLLQTCLFSSCFLLPLHAIPVSGGCSAIHKLLLHRPLYLSEAISLVVKGRGSGARLLSFEICTGILPRPFIVYDLGPIM